MKMKWKFVNDVGESGDEGGDDESYAKGGDKVWWLNHAVLGFCFDIGDCRVAFATKSFKIYDEIVHFVGFDRCAERTNEFTFGHTGHMDIILGRYGC